MTDLARLGIGVDATKVIAADKALDDLSAAARTTAAEVKKVEAASKSAGAELEKTTQKTNAAAKADKDAAAAARALAKEARDKAKAVAEAAKEEERAAKSAARETAKAQRESAAASAADMRERARQANEIAAAAAQTRRRTQAEMINLSRQAQDVAVSLFSGQNPLTVIAQQGAQIGDIIATSEGRVTASLGRMASAAGRFLIGPVGVAGMALTAAASFGILAESSAASSRDIERRLVGVGRASGQTAGSIEAMSISAARGSPMSEREMRSAITGFASQGISGSLLPQAAGQVRGFSLATGQSYDDAQKELGSALASPTAGAEKLNQRFGFLNQALLDYIRNAEQAGDKTRAQKAILDAMAPSVAEAAKQVGAFTRMWESTTKVASDFYSVVERGAGRLVYGTTALQRYQEAQAAVTAFEQGYAGRTLTAGQQRTLDRRRARAEQLRTPEAMAEQKRIEDAQRAVERNAISRQASSVVGGLFDDVQRRQTLTSQRDLLIKALGDPQTVREMGDAGARANDALAAVTASLENFETASQRAAKDNELAIASTLAYTMAERTAVEMERARTEALRNGRSELEASVAAEQARQRALAESKRQADEMLRDARETAGMVGLSPAAARRQAILNRYGRAGAQSGGDAGGPAMVGTGAVPAIEYGTGLEPAGGGLRFTVGGRRQFSTAGGHVDTASLAPAFAELLRKLVDGLPNAMITSAHRSVAYNRAVGGVEGSNHTRGTAADIVNYGSIEDLRARAAALGLRVIPSNGGAAHVDMGREGAAMVAANTNNRPSGVTTAADATRGSAMAMDLTSEGRRAMEDWSAPINQATRSLEEQKRALEQQRGAMGMSVAEMTRMSEAQRLQNEYTRDGTVLTPQLSAAIDEYARQAGEAAEEQRKLSESQRQVSELNGALADGVKGFISDLRQGKSAAEAFSNALGRIGDKLLDMAINSIFGAGGAQGGLLGQILGAFLPKPGAIFANGAAFAHGRVTAFAAGAVVNGPTIFPMADGMGLMGEAGPEAIMPLSRDRSGRLGVSAPRAANSNRPMQINFGDTRIEIAGNADNETVAALSEALADNRRDLARMAREMESMNYASEYGVSLGKAA